MIDKVNVRKHTRRRTGRAAEFAAKMGYDTDVRIDSYPRRRPSPGAYHFYTVRVNMYLPDGSVWDSNLVTGIYARNRSEARRLAKKEYAQIAKRGGLKVTTRFIRRVVAE